MDYNGHSKIIYRGNYGYEYSKNYYIQKKKDAFRNFNKNKCPLKEHNVHCGSIILNEDNTKILLVKNRYLWEKFKMEKWSPPKGHYEREKDKNYLDAAIRETYEETGIQLKYKQIKPLMIRINLTYYFPISISEESVQNCVPVDKWEIIETKWIELKEIEKTDYVKKNRDLKVILDRFKHRILNIVRLQK